MQTTIDRTDGDVRAPSDVFATREIHDSLRSRIPVSVTFIKITLLVLKLQLKEDVHTCEIKQKQKIQPNAEFSF